MKALITIIIALVSMTGAVAYGKQPAMPTNSKNIIVCKTGPERMRVLGNVQSVSGSIVSIYHKQDKKYIDCDLSTYTQIK